MEQRVFAAVRQDNVQALAKAAKSIKTKDPAHPAESDPEAWSKIVNTLEASSGMTPLMVAASINNLRSVKFLLASGADPNLLSSSGGETAIHFCIKSRGQRTSAPQVLASLLNAGANPMVLDRRGISPLALARRVESKQPFASQVLRTLEMNNCYIHGTVSVEEHSDISKMAGSVVQFLSGSHQDGMGFRNQVTQAVGGSFRSRFFVLVTTRVAPEPEIAIYESFYVTRPSYVLPISTVTIGPAVRNAVSMLKAPSRVQATLTSPQVSMQVSMQTTENLERWRQAVNQAQADFQARMGAVHEATSMPLPTQTLMPSPAAPAAFGGAAPPPTMGGYQGMAGSPQFIPEATPIEEGAGSNLAEAVVVLGPAEGAHPPAGAEVHATDEQAQIAEAMRRSLQDPSATVSSTLEASAPPPPVILPSVPELPTAPSAPSAQADAAVDDEIAKLESQLRELKKKRDG
uniref:Uncharacterized protein n=1 Tax=Rhizochromulina marina TaxID=1034831 RepID=A0A7S2SQH0_9STRA